MPNRMVDAVDNPIEVNLFSENGLGKHYAKDVEAWFERYRGPVSVKIISRPVNLESDDAGIFTWTHVFSVLNQLRNENQVPKHSFCFLLTKSQNEMNWFAASDNKQMRNGFGQVDDFSWFTSAPPSVVIVHYILKTIYNALVTDAGIDWETLWHLEPRGCFCDFCMHKAELSLKLRTADICGDCMQAFQSVGVPESLLKQTITIMEASRKLALNTSQYLSSEPIFERWPFPVAITRHKAVQATNPLLRFLLLLDHFDSLVRYFYLTHEIHAGRQPKIIDRPSLGWWVEQLALSLRGVRNFREGISIAQREQVVNLRNERRGHGWMLLNVDNYQGDAERLEGILGKIETELEPFLTSYHLAIPRQVTITDDGYLVEGELLLGSHILHPNFSVKLTDPRTAGITGQNTIYLTNIEHTEFKCISPYILSTICPTCNHPRILITDGANQYIDVLMGHRVEI